MALLMMDGFDQYKTGDNDIVTNPLWDFSGTVRYYTTPTPPYGRGAVVGLYDYSYIKTYPLGQLTEVVFGFHWRTTQQDEGNTIGILGTLSTDDTQLFLGSETLANGGGFGLYRGWRTDIITRSTLTNSSYKISPNEWYWIEIKHIVHDTTGTFELRVNGETWIDYTGDTKGASGYTGIECIRLSTSNNDWNYIDNFYLADTSTAGNAQVYDFQGPSEIITLLPETPDTATINWTRSAGTTNFENVDDIPADDTDYVYTDTSGDVDEYNYQNLPVSGYNIKAVQPMARLEMQEAGLATMTIDVTSGTSRTTTGIDIDAGGNIEYVLSDPFETSDGTNVWTESDINSLTVSYEYD
jgi:hypothetical protein